MVTVAWAGRLELHLSPAGAARAQVFVPFSAFFQAHSQTIGPEVE